ncbi:hypothetical protein PR003_g17254 [Phytophthora rubi]|uniref:RxLR effector protein n=1 Tax=Phytophthora rubi TaxID=129364 RepID=A0A6A3N9L9_9STRA|nr:hypothetical protein PR001_g8580 [Phytophthora rubi]KAE9043200.1 hypothetical protein PR002_g3475 [Phytophthora rubi]KAE9322368.1 hypothetical protein PR003_g17254 [Phytophthora rubi]
MKRAIFARTVATFLVLGTVSTGKDHRLDRGESEKGFQVCAVENFKDTLFCSICRKCKDPGEVADNSVRKSMQEELKEIKLKIAKMEDGGR